MNPGGIQNPGRAVCRCGPEDQRRKDSQNGLPPLPGSGNSVGGGVQETDDGSGTFQPGEAVDSGTVHRVWGGDGAQVASSIPEDAVWEESGGEKELENHGPLRGSTYLSFLPPACPGYHHRFGEGKILPPTVSKMQHAGALAYNEWEAPRHQLVRQWDGEELQMAGGGGTVGEFGEGLTGLWGTAGDSHIFQVPGTSYDSGGRRMDGSGRQINKGSE